MIRNLVYSLLTTVARHKVHELIEKIDGDVSRSLLERKVMESAPTVNAFALKVKANHDDEALEASRFMTVEQELDSYAEHDPNPDFKSYFCGDMANLDDIVLHFDVLQWWCDKQRSFPRLSALAEHILMLQASSASSERVFSHSGNLKSKTRGRMSSVSMEEQVILKSNQDLWTPMLDEQQNDTLQSDPGSSDSDISDSFSD